MNSLKIAGFDNAAILYVYTCQLSRIMRESHASMREIDVFSPQGNFSRLTHKSGQVVL